MNTINPIKSKSQLKRESMALQNLGIEILNLNLKQIYALNLPLDLEAALSHAKTLKSHEALRRQSQFIGKIMRDLDTENIKTQIKTLSTPKGLHHEGKAKALEWQTKLLSGDKNVLAEFIKNYLIEDIQSLRHLIQQSRKSSMKQNQSTSTKTLYQFICEKLDKKMPPTQIST